MYRSEICKTTSVICAVRIENRGNVMMKYVSLMVLAYCESTGKSEEDALKDLSIDDFVHTQDLDNITSMELLSMMPKDTSGLMAWAKAAKK